MAEQLHSVSGVNSPATQQSNPKQQNKNKKLTTIRTVWPRLKSVGPFI